MHAIYSKHTFNTVYLSLQTYTEYNNYSEDENRNFS